MVRGRHPVDAPALLTEVRRVLKPDGVVLIVGEDAETRPLVVRSFRYWARLGLAGLPSNLQRALRGQVIARPARMPWQRHFLREHDTTKGDTHYTPIEYRRMFSRAGFEAREADNHSWFVLSPAPEQTPPP